MRPAAQKPAGKRRHVLQGEFFVTDDPDMSLTTVLGSCVAACICDPLAGVGGMNHFLLPGSVGRGEGQAAERQGAHIMELLLNGLYQHGAQRARLEAKLFGGASMFQGLTDIGAKNAAFAEHFLKHEGIRVVGGSLGGQRGRRVEYWPASGRARAHAVSADLNRITPIETARIPTPSAGAGAVELF
jgi:chemotaxis protein CheD